jgi:hypothetical protein
MSANDLRTCPSCGAAVRDGAKFCPSCGAKIPAVTKPAGSKVTIDEVRKWLSEACVEEADGMFTLKIYVDDRSQHVHVGVYQDEDGDSEFDKINIFSIFASIDEVTLKDAISGVSLFSFGMKRIGDTYALYTSARIESFASVQSFADLVEWVAIQADVVERELLGTDWY